MRPLYIKISAFGPYAGVTEIDMAQLGKNGVYLITGDTGRGKTTIFDAVCFALYGQASGTNRESAMLRSKYADRNTPTEVELTFENKNRVYTVKRNPDYMRPAKRGTGEKKETAKAELTMPGGSVITGNTTVTAEIRNIIGVDKNQFSQIAMIAQGDFMKLLLAKTEDRQKIFREIFKTYNYENLQKQLGRRSLELKDEYTLAGESVNQYISGIVCRKNSGYADMVASALNRTLPVGEVPPLIEKILEEDETAYKKLLAEAEVLDECLAQLTAQKTKLDEYTRLEKEYAGNITLLSSRNILLRQLSEKLSAEKAKLPLQEERTKHIAEISAQYGDYEKYRNLTDMINQSESTIRSAQQYSEKGRWEEAVLKAELEDLKTEHRSKEKAGENRRLLMNERQTAEAEKEKLLRLKKDVIHCARLEKQAEQCRQEYISAYSTAAELQNRYRQMNKMFMDEQAGVLASALREGTPCPVCGSLHHPAKAVLSRNAPSEKDVKDAKNKADAALARSEEKSRLAGSAKGNMEAAKEMLAARVPDWLAGYSFDTLCNRIDDECAQLAETVNLKTALIKTEDMNIRRRAELEKIIPAKESLLSQLTERIIAAEKTVSAETASAQQLKKQVAEIKSGLKYESLYRAQTAVKQLEKANAEEKRQLERVTASCNACEKEISSLQAVIHRQEKMLASGPQGDMAQLIADIDNCTMKKSAIAAQRNDVHARNVQNNRTLQNIIRKSEYLAEIEEKWKWVRALANTANGNITGKDKIMLETYIQATYFDRIIARANRRFMIMTGGQYDLVRHQGAVGGNSKSGLELDVKDHYNGTVRSVKTLSGGESFKASLSLALGLSDEIQSSAGGIKLDTMFVDEGFGSLDGESLTQAMAALTSLADGNRLVGIISHVSELKEKIDNQIIVTKDKSGGSRVKIVTA